VIEDAALAIGAEFGFRKAGTIGQVGCFSLSPGKMLGAYGDGGVVITDSREIADRVRVLRNYGYAAGTGENLGGVLGMESCRLVAEGFNERLDTLQAAIVRAKLSTLENRITRRREIADRYNNGLAGLNLVTPYAASEARHVYRAYTVLVDDRGGLRRHLASIDIATRVYYVPPLHLQPVYEHLGFELGDFPVTEELADKMLALPLFPEMTDSQVEQVIEGVEAYLTDAT
jgi:dTDP-4-amino-4,6-dideoxygalactose transaminase